MAVLTQIIRVKNLNKKKSYSSTVTCLSPFLRLISQSCWLATRCQVDQFVPSANFWGQFMSKLLTFVQLIPLPRVCNDDHQKKCETLQRCSTFLFATSQYRTTQIWACPSTSQQTTLQFVRAVFPILVIFPLLQQKYMTQTPSCAVNDCCIRCAFTLSASQIHMVEEVVWVRQDPHPCFINLSHKGSCHFDVIHINRVHDFVISSNLGASSLSTWVSADTASAPCPANPCYVTIT